jgi:hypothetical protein
MLGALYLADQEIEFVCLTKRRKQLLHSMFVYVSLPHVCMCMLAGMLRRGVFS